MEKTGEQLRDEGMARAAAARRLVLEEVKAIAVGIAEASPDRTCHAGLLVEPIKQRGLPRGNYLQLPGLRVPWLGVHRRVGGQPRTTTARWHGESVEAADWIKKFCAVI
jgi:hypothetical protein